LTSALITGVTGQDGYYLATHLNALGVEVWGVSRSGEAMPELPEVRVLVGDLLDQGALERAIATVRPDEIYHLAAQTSVAASWELPVATGNATGLGTARLLESVARRAPAARVFVASSAEVFGDADRLPQDESTPLRPVSPYGAAKAYAHHLAHVYRRRGLFVAVGILYNHESPRRPPTYVTRKITRGAVAIARGELRDLRLGPLEAVRDWGFAGDHVRAMPLMLRQPEPEDFVVATGERHVVRDWCVRAFARVGLNWQDHVFVDPTIRRPAESHPLVGDATKARRHLGWAPTVAFEELIDLMVDADLAESAARAPVRSGAAGR
jgi:GDPmannose 4,6-dehydratase